MGIAFDSERHTSSLAKYRPKTLASKLIARSTPNAKPVR